MRKPVMSMPPIAISPASQARSAQASSINTPSAAIVITRSRRNTASSTEPLIAQGPRSAHDAGAGQVQVAEVGVGVFEIVLDWAEGLTPAAAIFGRSIFEPVGEVDPGAMRLLGH